MRRLAVSVGCPCGIGPEVSVAAAAAHGRTARDARALLVGDFGAVSTAARIAGVAPERLVRVVDPDDAWSLSSRAIAVYQPTRDLAAKDRRAGAPGRAAGAAQLAWIDAGADLVVRGAADALVTGPVSKDAIASSGAPRSKGFIGHTEHLAARLHAREVTMAFYTERLTTSLVTTHLALRDVAHAVTAREVARAVYWTARFVDSMQCARSVAVAALNPHAGENGRLGTEERRILAPGIVRARARLAKDGVRVAVEGPIPAETAFRIAAGGAFAAVVAMYHDQATIPMKLLGFGEAVNVSLGLPIVRTSVDHGTAYDRAGKGTADPRAMIEAMKLAARLVSGRA